MSQNKNNNIVENRCYGLVIIKSKNSNFNADFTGNPRRLPDEEGTIYATDKVIKYSIRRFWVDNDENVFVWRSHTPDGKLRTRDSRMEYMKQSFANEDDFKKLQDNYCLLKDKTIKSFKHIENEIENAEEEQNEDFKNLLTEMKNELENNSNSITNSLVKEQYEKKLEEIKKIITASVFSKCIDTKLFGVTFSGDNPLSLTGPVQFSYGVNRLENNTVFVDDILSPYPTGNEATVQGSIGKDQKNLESYYVYDFSINPKNIITHYNSNDKIKKMMKITEEDIDLLKDALKHSVTSLDTTSKKDSENALLLFITLPKNSKYYLPAMKDLVEIKKDDKNTIINLERIKDLLNTYDVEKIENLNVELYYNEFAIEVEAPDENNWDIEKRM